MELGTFALGKRFAVIGKYRHGLLTSTRINRKDVLEIMKGLRSAEVRRFFKHNSKPLDADVVSWHPRLLILG